MKPLLQKQEICYRVSREEFLADIDCLFDVLKDTYGLYAYFGDEAFAAAKAEIVERLKRGAFEIREAISFVTEVFASFIKDGHFRIGPGEALSSDPGFAVRHTALQGIPHDPVQEVLF